MHKSLISCACNLNYVHVTFEVTCTCACNFAAKIEHWGRGYSHVKAYGNLQKSLDMGPILVQKKSLQEGPISQEL